MKVSPLAPENPPRLPPIAGLRLATMAAGIKYAGRTDLLMMMFDNPAVVAGVFTQSRCPSAPVDWCRRLLHAGEASARAVVVNAGNANAFTGRRGAEATLMTANAASAALGCANNEVFLASTGVIGEPLDASVFGGALQQLAGQGDENGWSDAAEAIMTTDTYPKVSTATADVDGETITVNGIAKGSGMIAPDMATMLAFLATDMPVSRQLLQDLLGELVGGSFNAITVDSDTSTSDTVLLFSTASGNIPVLADKSDQRFDAFKTALGAVLHDLAMQIVRDGEGATKHIEIAVSGAESDESARKIALSIANSPLVKTAVAGEDANWGRVVMAVGKAGERADRDKLSITFGDVRVAVHGERDPDYVEETASEVMRKQDIRIGVDVGVGIGESRVWSCDLTKEYVAINGDYRS